MGSFIHYHLTDQSSSSGWRQSWNEYSVRRKSKMSYGEKDSRRRFLCHTPSPEVFLYSLTHITAESPFHILFYFLYNIYIYTHQFLLFLSFMIVDFLYVFSDVIRPDVCAVWRRHRQ